MPEYLIKYPRKNILTSNRFGELTIDTKLPDIREVADLEEVDKENVNILNSQGIEKSTNQDSKINSGKRIDKMISVNKTGPNDKRAGKMKANTSHKPNARTGLNWPMCGLVFGSTRGELEQSKSRKRLRVENGNAGRLGGVYTEAGELSGNGSGRNLSLGATQSVLSKSPNGGSSAEVCELRT